MQKILIVDLALFLIPEYAVYTATDSRSALILYQEIQPDICILDIKMPHFVSDRDELEGLALANRIYDSGKHNIPFIMVSKYSMPENPVKKMQYTYMQKPIKIGLLKNVLHELIN